MNEVLIHRFLFELNNYCVEELPRFGIDFPSGIPMINSRVGEM